MRKDNKKYWREKGAVRVRFSDFRSDPVRLKQDYYRYTMPVLANEFVWGCGFTMFSVIMEHLGSNAFAAFVLRLPVLVVYFLLNLGELIKLPAVYRHYRQYKWVKNLITNQS